MRWGLAALAALLLAAPANAATLNCHRAEHAERHMAFNSLERDKDRVVVPSCWRIPGGRRVTVYAYFNVVDNYPRVWVHWTDTLRIHNHKLVVTAGDLHADGLPPF